MKRREFIVAVAATTASGLAILPIDQAAADTSQSRRVALVTSGQGVPVLELIRSSLKKLGYEEGKNLVIDFREAKGNYASLPGLLTDVIALNPDVIIAEATPAIAAAQQATSTIPIVMAPSTDPIGSGFVKSFAHPGGNITGVANMFGDLTAKTLDIVRLAFPNVKKIGVLISNNPTHPNLLDVAIKAAGAIGITAEGFIAANPEDLETAFADMKGANCEVVYVLADPPRPALPPIALNSGLPTIFQVSSYTAMGGLMSYGPEITAFFTSAASYVDRILKGAKPADIPVEQPTTFLFVVNLRTAKALGLTIPEQVLLMADKVIE
ncbi:ABC transporter substrate-binding protein [Bradyrhizobium sp. NAS96.2]|uniref:ABC transporter substrate-binding protein n=1 Tax=Bradyrhizobium sp. NAS96.2 TaxID=1680160 RepID=UPI0009F91BEE|nr:ABC transporter substrate-binding protein [Bradyrhizobium sp. NAS96.2]